MSDTTSQIGSKDVKKKSKVTEKQKTSIPLLLRFGKKRKAKKEQPDPQALLLQHEKDKVHAGAELDLAQHLKRLTDEAVKLEPKVRDKKPDDRGEFSTTVSKTTERQRVDLANLRMDLVDPKIGLDNFKVTVEQRVREFGVQVNTAIETLREIAKRPGRTPDERDRFVEQLMQGDANDPSRQAYEVLVERLLTARREQGRLENAIDAMTDRMAELKQQRAGETREATVKRLGEEVTKLQDARKLLDDKLQLIEAYRLNPPVLDDQATKEQREALKIVQGDRNKLGDTIEDLRRQIATKDKRIAEKNDRIATLDTGPLDKEIEDLKAPARALELVAEYRKQLPPDREALTDDEKEVYDLVVQGGDELDGWVATFKQGVENNAQLLAQREYERLQIQTLAARDREIALSPAGKKEIEDEYNILKAQIEVLKQREKAMKGLWDDQNNRIDAMMSVKETRAKQKTEFDQLTNLTQQRPVDLDNPAFAFLKTMPDIGLEGGDATPAELAKGLREQNLALQQQVRRVHETVDRGQRLSPGEPELPRISAAERDMLLGLLDPVAWTLIRDIQPEAAAKVHAHVQTLLVQFTNDTARQTALPPVTPPDPDPEKDLTTRVKALEPKILDLDARGRAGDFETQRKELADKLVDEAKKTPPDWTALTRAVGELEDKVAEAAKAPPQPVGGIETKRQAAKDTKNKINAKLIELMRAKPLTAKELERLDAPGKVWGYDENGKSLKPDDAIPYEDVITVVENGKEVAYRIKTKDTGAKDVVERHSGFKHVPREMMARLRSDAEVLDLMAQGDVVGPEMEEALAAFILEAEERLDAVMKGDDDYKAAEKEIEKIDDLIAKKPWFSDNPLKRMNLTGLPKLQKELADLKRDYVRMLPADAKKAAEELHKKFVTLKEDGDKLLQTYEGAKKTAKDNLHNFKDAGTGMTLGLQFMADRTGDFSAKAGDKLTPEEKEQIDRMAERMDRNFDFRGAWMTEMQAGYRLLRQKTDQSVKDGKDKVDAVIKEIDEFNLKYQMIIELAKKEPLTDEDRTKLAEFSREALKVMTSAVEGDRAHKANLVKWEQERDAVREKLKEAEKAVKKSSQKELLGDRLKALEARKDSVKGEVEEFEDYPWGLGQLAEIRGDLDLLIEEATADKTEGGKIGKPVAAKNADSVKRWLTRLSEQTQALNKAYLEGLADEQQKAAMGPAFTAVETSMKQVTKPIGDAEALVRVCGEIDAMIGDKTMGYPDRLKLRERAMAEVRRLRDALTANPALDLFRSNPFPDRDPTAATMLLGALHACETAILTSVDPRDAKTK